MNNVRRISATEYAYRKSLEEQKGYIIKEEIDKSLELLNPDRPKKTTPKQDKLIFEHVNNLVTEGFLDSVKSFGKKAWEKTKEIASAAKEGISNALNTIKNIAVKVLGAIGKWFVACGKVLYIGFAFLTRGVSGVYKQDPSKLQSDHKELTENLVIVLPFMKSALDITAESGAEVNKEQFQQLKNDMKGNGDPNAKEGEEPKNPEQANAEQPKEGGENTQSNQEPQNKEKSNPENNTNNSEAQPQEKKEEVVSEAVIINESIKDVVETLWKKLKSRLSSFFGSSEAKESANEMNKKMTNEAKKVAKTPEGKAELERIAKEEKQSSADEKKEGGEGDKKEGEETKKEGEGGDKKEGEEAKKEEETEITTEERELITNGVLRYESEIHKLVIDWVYKGLTPKIIMEEMDGNPTDTPQGNIILENKELSFKTNNGYLVCEERDLATNDYIIYESGELFKGRHLIVEESTNTYTKYNHIITEEDEKEYRALITEEFNMWTIVSWISIAMSIVGLLKVLRNMVMSLFTAATAGVGGVAQAGAEVGATPAESAGGSTAGAATVGANTAGTTVQVANTTKDVTISVGNAAKTAGDAAKGASDVAKVAKGAGDAAKGASKLQEGMKTIKTMATINNINNAFFKKDEKPRRRKKKKKKKK